MNRIAARVGGYGVAAALSGGLIYAGFVYETDPDLLTMVSSVQVQLQLAAVMPERDADGNVVEERARLLDSAAHYLNRIDHVQPDFAPACGFRAYLSYLQRDYDGAAQLYEKVRSLPGCSPKERDQAVINQARMLRLAGDHDAAVLLLRGQQEKMSAEYSEVARRELAGAERAAGKEQARPTSAPAEAAGKKASGSQGEFGGNR